MAAVAAIVDTILTEMSKMWEVTDRQMDDGDHGHQASA